MSNKSKLWPVLKMAGDEVPYAFMFECPGCGCYHSLTVTEKNEFGSQWKFDGNYVNPTFSPSLMVKYENHKGQGVCHSFIRDGYIQFLSDCTHSMAGVTTELPEVE